MSRLSDSLIGLSFMMTACTHYYGRLPWQKECLSAGCDWPSFATCQRSCVTRFERASERACYEWSRDDIDCYYWMGVSAEELVRWERMR